MAVEAQRATPIQNLIEYSVTNGGSYDPKKIEYPYVLISMAYRQEPGRRKWVQESAFPDLSRRRLDILVMAGLATRQSFRLPADFKLTLPQPK